MSNVIYLKTGYVNSIPNVMGPASDFTFIFSTGNTEWMPIFMRERLHQIGEINKRVFLNISLDNGGRVNENNVKNALLSSNSPVRYKRSRNPAVFQAELYTILYYNQVMREKEILCSAVIPAFTMSNINFPVYSGWMGHSGSIHTLPNPREYLGFRFRRTWRNRNDPVNHWTIGYNREWRTISSDFTEFWVNRMMHPSNKSLTTALKQERTNINKLVNYFADSNVKVLYKSSDEMNQLLYKPASEPYSIEQFRLWEDNMRQMVIDSFSKVPKKIEEDEDGF